MFTLKQIKQAHSTVLSGADFPAYIHKLVNLGVKSYTVFVRDGHTEYFGDEGFSLISPALYAPLSFLTVHPTQFKVYLERHQAGETDYLTFCRDAAESGVEKWVVDMGRLTCTYFAQGTAILVEHIPKVV